MHDFDVYRGIVFDHKKFAAFLARHQVSNWPLTPFNRLAVNDETMARMARKHRVLAPSMSCERKSPNCV